MLQERKLPASIRLAPWWWRRRVALVVAALMLGLVVYERGIAKPTGGDDYSRYHDQVFAVVNVVDGDTIDIDFPDDPHLTTRIRLWGVDTPEVVGSPSGAKYFGDRASLFGKKKLQGRDVRIVLSPTKTRGKYGRLLAYVYLVPEGQMYNEMLLEGGYAYADWRFAHPFRRQFEQLEKNAKRRGEGLWADLTTEQMPAWRQRMAKDRS